MNLYRCRFCANELKYTFVDLGVTPLANSYLRAENLDSAEPFYSLHVRVCDKCFLVQLPELALAEQIFSDYLYFSSYSGTWLDHAKSYCAQVAERFNLDENSRVIEIGGNDGYLLQYFKERNIGILNVEPAGNVAEIAVLKGIPTLVKFFGAKTAQRLVSEGNQPDLVVANNVLAHVPDINDFVKGFEILLKPQGVATFEFPHLYNLIEQNQFDTIYHEHFSYLSLIAVERIFAAHGLTVFDVEELPTHGGSLRVFAQKTETGKHAVGENVGRIKDLEVSHGLTDVERLTHFDEQVKRTKWDLVKKLIEIKNENKTIVAYGAAAKGNTLLNYCGIKTDFIDYVCDANPNKQNCFLPGTRIPVAVPEKILETKPDYVLILPWNIAGEIIEKYEGIRDWGAKFIVPIPTVQII